MTPLYIGAPGRRLYACLHPAESAGSAAVLLCPPFGFEMVRAHRLLRVLAERLARNGIAVMRFDPYGAGDSLGTDEQLDLTGWQSDVLTAHEHLAAWSGRSRIVWMGLRLGANACMLAASANPPALRRVVLCEPILDGRAYLGELRRRHVALLDAELGRASKSTAADLAQSDPQAFCDEAFGIAISGGLRREVVESDWQAMLGQIPAEATLVLDEGRIAELKRSAERARFVPAAESVDWLADLPEDGTLLPGKLAAQLTKEITDACA
ncbi:MAG: alpha/beta hydrolase [Proteobacteria bacterium]|nr:alpha/beta hydrolase [Pseudomonadota bacterium]